MTENNPSDGGEQYPEESAEQELQNQKQIIGKLYRMKDIIAGLIALSESGGISAGQVRSGLKHAFQKNFK